MLYLVIFTLFAFAFAEKVYVVERERGAVAVVEEGRLLKEIKNLGNLSHATLKFFKGSAYLISRDGYLFRIDTERNTLLEKVKVGESSIGFTFCGGKVAVANYSPKSVVFLSPDLKVLHRIETGSRNVGIKSTGDLLIFALMDKDEVWILDCGDYSKVKVFRNVGDMPFDAFIAGKRYVVGFFREDSVGVVDVEKLSYRKVRFRSGEGEVVFKVPHFGLWAVSGSRAYVPAVGERKIHLVDLKDFRYEGSLELPGLPVFVKVSPDGRFLAVNYSGDMEDFLTIVDREKGKIVKTKRLGRRILHFSFTPDGRFIYLSSYYESKLKKVKVPELEVVEGVSVPTPSGVFIGGD